MIQIGKEAERQKSKTQKKASIEQNIIPRVEDYE